MKWKICEMKKNMVRIQWDSGLCVPRNLGKWEANIDVAKSPWGKVERVFLRTDCVTYTTVMHRLAETGDVDGAIQAWKSMRLDKCQPTVVSYTEYIRILLKKGRPEEAAGVYREMLATGIQPNCHTYTVLIEYLADQGKFEEAFGILDEMKNLRIEPSKATFNILVEKCAKAGKTNLINEILLLMRYLGHVLRLPIFMKALEAFEKAGETTDLLRAVHPHLCYVSPCSRNPHFVNDDNNDKLALLIDVNMIWYLLRYKSLLAIKIMLEEMLLAGVALSNAVLSTIIKECSFKEEVATAMIAYKYCKTLDIQLDRDAYASLVGLLLRNRSFESTVQVCNDMIEKGVKPGSYVLTVLIKRLGHAGLSDTAEKLFEALTSEHNVAAYTGLIEVFMNSTTTTDKALGLFLRMKRHGVRPARGTYTVLQLGLEKACRYQEANKFRQHRVMLRTGFLNSKNMELEEDYYETLCNLLFDSDSHVYGLDIRQVTNSTFVGPKSSNVNEIH